MQKVRIDKWLWSVRIFKSRTLATDAIKSNKVKIGEENAKPADHVNVGQTVFVKKEGFHLQFLVKELIEKRVGAPIAVQCYENLTPADELNKYNEWYVGKSGSEKRGKGDGRPTKKDRREIDGFKTDRYEED